MAQIYEWFLFSKFGPQTHLHPARVLQCIQSENGKLLVAMFYANLF